MENECTYIVILPGSLAHIIYPLTAVAATVYIVYSSITMAVSFFPVSFVTPSILLIK